jgi:hypothetical protein
MRAAAAAAVISVTLVTLSAHPSTLLGMPRAEAQGQRGGGAAPPAPPPTPRAGALIDLTGYWVSVVTEDWRYRQFTPPKGDYTSVPLNPNGRKVADTWDPAKDETAGEQCKAYGAAGVMRVPTRLHITWQDDTTLKLDTDAGTQTRTLRFGQAQGTADSWQGVSIASWDQPRAIFASPIPNRGGPTIMGGSLKIVTTNMKPGYLRKNGVPYSANAVMTEYFDRLDVPGVESLIVVTAELVDPEYLLTPYWTSTHFRQQTDATGWRPTPCTAR